VTNGNGYIKWRVQCGEDCTETSQCLRRDAGIAGRVGCVLPCTLLRTCCAQGGIHSLPHGCTGRVKPLQSATFLGWCSCGPRCEDWRIGCSGWQCDACYPGYRDFGTQPTNRDDRSAGFDPVTYDVHQCVGGSVRNGNKECFAGLAFNTTKHPLTLNPSAWGHLNPSSYCDVGRLFYGVFKLWSKLQRKKWRNNF